MKAEDVKKGTKINGALYAIRDFEVKEAADGKRFAKCVLFDSTGELAGIWFKYPGTRERLEPTDFVCKVTGTGDEFNGKPQIKIDEMSIMITGPGYDFSPFVRASQFSRQQLATQISLEIGSIRDEELALVVAEIFYDADNFDRFMDSPAAQGNHHAYRHGLAEHVSSMCALGRLVAGHYNDLYGPDSVDVDLVVAGILLHDFGKIWDFDPDGLGVKYSLHGQLVSHIPECDTQIAMKCREHGIARRTEQRLRHVVLSHHGLKEWGSPVEPSLVEARIVHQVDMIDSKLAMMRDLLDGLDPGEVSARSWALGGRVVK